MNKVMLTTPILVIILFLSQPSEIRAGDAELQAVAECTKKSVDAASFVICTGGKLTINEAIKCFSGNCLGEGNEMVKLHNWIDRNLFGGTAFGSNLGAPSKLVLYNRSHSLVEYAVQPQWMDWRHYTLKPGYWAEISGDTRDEFFNISFEGDSDWVNRGGIGVFEDTSNGVRFSDITPRHIYFDNGCSRKVKLAIRYREPGGEWVSNGWWRVDGNEVAYLANNKHRIASEYGYLYYYAETIPPRYKWSGDDSIEFEGSKLPMKGISVKRDGSRYYLGIEC